MPSSPFTSGRWAYTGSVAPSAMQDVDLRRRVRDVVVAADHVRDPVEHVLDRRGEVVGRASVGADDHEVGEVLVLELDPPADGVVPADDALVGHPEADRSLVEVGLAFLDEPLRVGAHLVHPVELEGDRAVPVDPEPPERLLDLLGGLGDLAARVGVLDPQAALAALLARVEPVEEERPDTADMQEAGRARGHADANAHAGHRRRRTPPVGSPSVRQQQGRGAGATFAAGGVYLAVSFAYFGVPVLPPLPARLRRRRQRPAALRLVARLVAARGAARAEPVRHPRCSGRHTEATSPGRRPCPGSPLLLAPVTLTAGPVAAYNVAAILMPALAATTAFLLCRHVTRSFWPSLAGGYLFGFSSYVLGHELAHLHATSSSSCRSPRSSCCGSSRSEIGAGGLVVRLGPAPRTSAHLRHRGVLHALALPRRRARSRVARRSGQAAAPRARAPADRRRLRRLRRAREPAPLLRGDRLPGGDHADDP